MSSSSAKMRLGGMQYAEMHFNLPVKFKIINSLAGNGKTIFYAVQDENGDIEWIYQNMIIISGIAYKLLYNPSYRTNWCTFTI